MSWFSANCAPVAMAKSSAFTNVLRTSEWHRRPNAGACDTMQQSMVYFVGTEAEVRHHARALQPSLDVRIVSPSDVCRTAQPGDVAIFYSEHFDRFRDAIRQLRDRAVATIYAIDGILEWRNAWANRNDEPACPWTMRPGLCDKIACIGRHQARILGEWGNRGRIEVVGIPRLDGLTAAAALRTKHEKLPTAPFRLLIMTAKFPGFTPEQIAVTTQSLIDLRDWVRANPTIEGSPIEVTWRLTQGLDERIGVTNWLSDTSGGELAEILGRVDAVVTTPSTAMLEAMLFGLPVATLDYHNVPSYVPPAWTIGNASAIGAVLEQLRNPSAERRFFQETVLRDELEFAGSATGRMAHLVCEMQKHAAACLAANQPLEFPSGIVPLPLLEGLDLPSSELFPGHAAFEEANPLRLQAELAHARREIVLLQATIEQLRGELGQAHEIFDQIHNHPIAGPVVRLRQKLIDAIGQLSSRKAKLDSLEKS